MKTIILSILVGIAGLLISQTLLAQERTTDRLWVSPNAEVIQTIGLTEIRVTYGRPSVNDREIFGGLVPYDRWWRTGANESTVVVFPEDVYVEGELVPKGVYSLYTIPRASGDWTVIINNKLSWGTQYDETEDFLRVDVTPQEAHHMEQMMIYFENVSLEQGDLVIHWDTVKVPVTIAPVAELPQD